MNRPRRVKNYQFVYFLRQEEFVKIGFTMDPLSRQSGLQVGSPKVHNLIALIEGGKDLEKHLHDLFKDSWEIGDWFKITPKITEWLTEHLGQLLTIEEESGGQLQHESTEAKPLSTERSPTLRHIQTRINEAGWHALKVLAVKHRTKVQILAIEAIDNLITKYKNGTFAERALSPTTSAKSAGLGVTRHMQTRVTPEGWHALKLLTLQLQRTLQELMVEAMNDLLVKYDQDPVVIGPSEEDEGTLEDCGPEYGGEAQIIPFRKPTSEPAPLEPWCC